jgi:hypothetical protein
LLLLNEPFLRPVDFLRSGNTQSHFSIKVTHTRPPVLKTPSTAAHLFAMMIHETRNSYRLARGLWLLLEMLTSNERVVIIVHVHSSLLIEFNPQYNALWMSSIDASHWFLL